MAIFMKNFDNIYGIVFIKFKIDAKIDSIWRIRKGEFSDSNEFMIFEYSSEIGMILIVINRGIEKIVRRINS